MMPSQWTLPLGLDNWMRGGKRCSASQSEGCYNHQDYNSNKFFYQINCYASTRDVINSHEIFSIDGDLFILQLWTIQEQRKNI